MILKKKEYKHVSNCSVKDAQTYKKMYIRLLRYSMHRTKESSCGPVMRGIYMPLTDAPTTGNINPSSKLVKGTYYVDVDNDNDI